MRRIVLLLTLVLLTPITANACSCAEFLDVPEGVKKSGLVFSGEVESIRVVELPEVFYSKDAEGKYVPSQHMTRRGVVTFRTLREWKGNHALHYTILAGAPSEQPLAPGHVIVDCQVHFEIGRRYLVFASEGYPEADICTPTAELARAKETIVELDAATRK